MRSSSAVVLMTAMLVGDGPGVEAQNVADGERCESSHLPLTLPPRGFGAQFQIGW